METESIIRRALNQFCFRNIWNETKSEYRANIDPVMVHSRSIVGQITIGGSSILLPTTNSPYYIFSTPLVNYYGILDIPNRQWLSVKDVCNTTGLNISIYSEEGRIVHKAASYVWVDKTINTVLFALDKKAVLKVVGTSDQANKIYITNYFDSDFANPVKIECMQVPLKDNSGIYRQQVINKLQTLILNSQNGLVTVYMDGFKINPTSASDIALDSYIDFVCDENIVAEYQVDLTTEDEIRHAFYSSKDELYKQIIHTPKELNPDNKVLTHNTCDFHIRRKSDNKGLYLHRCATRSVTNITHNDYAIPLYILNAYRDYLEDDNLIVEVSLRVHEKDNHLVRDKNFIDILYHHSDDDIKDILSKVKEIPIDFWDADTLESSVYLELMDDIPEPLGKNTISKYIEGVGFYHAVSIVCDRVISFPVTPSLKRNFIVSKPAVFLNKKTRPIIYRNGFKIKDDFIKYQEDYSGAMEIKIEDDILLQIDDVLTIVFVTVSDCQTYRFSPEDGNSSVLIDYEDFDVYLEVENDKDLQGFYKSSSKSYVKLNDLIGHIAVVPGEDKTKLIFSPNMYGNNYIISNQYAGHSFSENIDDQMQSGKTLTLNLVTANKLNEVYEELPILEFTDCSVYLNGCYLVDGVDYKINAVKDNYDRISFNQIIISNVSYLKPENNCVEILTHHAAEEDAEHGFVINNKISDERTINLWYDSISTLHVDGKLLHNVDYFGNHLMLTEAVRQGAFYELQTNIPKAVKEVLLSYHSNDDRERLVAINNYLNGNEVEEPPIVVVSQSHLIYSPYVNKIVEDVLNGELSGVGYDPDDRNMLNQLKGYDQFLDADPVQSGVDLNYIDVYPSYRQFETTPQLVAIIRRITDLLLPVDHVTDGEIVND